MKQKSTSSAIWSLAIFAVLIFLFSCKQNNTISSSGKPNNAKPNRMDEVAKAIEFEQMMLRNPATGKIPEGIFEAELQQAEKLKDQQITKDGVAASTYAFAGPENLGGRVRSIVYDVRYDGVGNRIIMAGGISGGIFKSTDNGATWVRKSPFTHHYSCTSIAQDTRVGFQDTWYYATGEAIGNSASAGGTGFFFGYGVYKSTDNGETWVRLATSNTGTLEAFDARQDFITKIAVDPTNGYVYIAALAAILRSTDFGATWGTVLTSSPSGFSTAHVTDIVINTIAGAGHKLYVSVSGEAPTTVDGVWSSATGASGAWTKIAGTGSATTPVGWNAKDAYERVVLAIAPSSENIVYALYNTSVTSTCGAPVIEAELFKWDEMTTTWTNLSANLPDEPGCSAGNDPFAAQGGYDLVVAVKPDDATKVFIGGTNIYRSTDGFTTVGATKRIGGYAGTGGYSLYASSHPDIHVITFQPGSPSIMLCGNDGGIQRTTDDLAVTVSWTPINAGFRTYQYYYVAIDPRFGNDKVLGGAQDNGSSRNIGGVGTSFETVWGGDGVSVGLGDVVSGSTYEYVGSQLGAINRRVSTAGLGIVSDIRPSASTGTTGLFVTVFHLDNDNTENLYYANVNKLYRTTTASTVTTGGWTELTGVAAMVSPATDISAMATTRGTYAAGTASLFIGTTGSKLFRVDNPALAGAMVMPVDISGAAFPVGGIVSSISVNPRNDDTVLVTFSNYGVTSAFWSGNANTATPTWRPVEGSLPLPSYRSSAIALNSGLIEYYVGTSVGLWRATIDGTSDVTALSTSWSQEAATDIGNAVVRHLAYRASDKTLLVGTHGNGMWKATLASPLPVNITSFTGKAEDRYNTLKWSTENEFNNKGYFIERKYMGQTAFATIGFVQALSNGTNAAASYSFEDATTDLSIGQTFYRLKQTDKDGQFKYSPTVILTRKPSVKLVEYITADNMNILVRMNNITGDKIAIRISDVAGKLMYSQTGFADIRQIPMNQWSSGTYVVEVWQGNKRNHVQKIVKN